MIRKKIRYNKNIKNKISITLKSHDFYKISSCPGCKSNRYIVLGELNKRIIINKNIVSIELNNKYELWRCNSCGLIFRNYMTKSETELKLQNCWKNENGEFHRWDPVNYSGYFKIKKYIDEVSQSIFNEKQRLNLLDLGIGEGKFINLFSDKYRTYGLESNPIQGFDYSRIVNGEILFYDIENNIEEPDKFKFHIITALDIFEHFSNPRKAIRNLHSMLHTNGLLFIETCNINSLIAKIMRYYNWWYVSVLEHKIFWSIKSLAHFLNKNGFKILNVKKKIHKGGISFNFVPILKYLIYNMSPNLYKYLLLYFRKTPLVPNQPRIPWKDHMLIVAQKA